MSGSRAKQYPPQNGQYAVVVKNGARWTNYDIARLQISVGQEYHESEKLRATFNWASHRFEKIIICVNDTLQRFNLEHDGYTPEEAFRISQERGDEWLKRNADLIASIPNTEIFRWEDWKAKPEYQKSLEEAESKYKTDSSFRREVDTEIEAFWLRKKKREGLNSDFGFHKFKKFSLPYLLEEIAVFPLMFERNRAVDVYPGSTLLPCKLSDTRDLGQRGFTRIDFRRNERPEIKHKELMHHQIA